LHNAARRVGRKDRGWLFFPLDLLGRGESDADGEPVDEAAMDQVEIEELRDLIGRLPLQHREAIVLRYYAGLTEPEMAQALGVPVGTVKSRLHSARLLLGRWLSPSSVAIGGENVGTRA
jgi:RNA polymerase sigma-70 factor (ECF subfamily)